MRRSPGMVVWASGVFLAGSVWCFGGINLTDPSVHAPSRVRAITLPHFEPELPLAPGRDEYLVVCVGCHSPRYVTMQPFFAQPQWEQTVDKMGKVYGARMDQEQRSAIIQYLVTTHGPDSYRAAANDEDSDFASMMRPIPRPASSPPLTRAAEGAQATKQIERGKELFAQNCASCHGPSGHGDGFLAPVLLCRPKNLASTRYSLELLSQVLWNGKRGTAMPSWRTLPQEDLSALSVFVQNLHALPAPDEALPGSLQRGGQVFVQNCAPCHGVNGDGKGTAAATLLPDPANFKLKQPDVAYILQVLSDGIPGTGMPAWYQQISEPDRRALAGFVRSLFQPGDADKH